MTERNSAALGFAWTVVAGWGAWLAFTPIEPFTVRALDALWIVLALGASIMLVRRRRASSHGLGHPLAALAFWPFMVAMMVLPVLGAIGNAGVPLSGLSSSLRFAIIATLPLLVSWLRIDRAAFWRGCLLGLTLSVAVNLGYATLQSAEFAGFLPARTLPHHQLSGFLPQSRFNDVGRASGLFLEGNHLAYFGSIAAVVFAGRFMLRPRASSMLWSFAALALPLLGNSRSALFATLAALFIMPILVLAVRHRTSKRLLPYASVALLALVAFALLAANVPVLHRALRIDRIEGSFAVLRGGLEADGSIRTRVLDLWPTAVATFEAHPLGLGVEPSTRIGTIDSAWLTYLLQGSLPLVLLFALFLGGAVALGLRTVRRGATPEARAVGLSLAAAAIIVAVGSVVLSPLHVPSVMLLFVALWIVAAWEPDTPW
jgi:hypothetical protein